MKKLVSILMVMSLLLSIFILNASASSEYTYDEIEPNNSVDTSDIIDNNYYVWGHLSYSYDMDYYKFTLPYRSNVYFSCCADDESLLAGLLDSSENLISAAHSEYYQGNYFDWLEITLDAGTYYICVIPSSNYYIEFPYGMTFEYSPEEEHIHDYNPSVVKPTCTKKGYTSYICSCGDSYTGNTKSALGHSESKWIIDYQPKTCAENGTKHTECTRCKKVMQTKEIKGSHSPVSILDEIPATYSATGLTEGSVCLTCGKEIVKQTTIPMIKLTKVSNLKSSSQTSNSISLKWSAVKGAKKYKVSYKKGDKWTSKTVSSNKITLSSLSPNTKYSIKVQAVNGSNKGEYSKTITIATKLSKTSKITPTCSTTSIKAAWKKVSGASGYKVELIDSKGKIKKTVKTKKTSYTFKDISKAKTYKIKVTAYKVIDKKYIYSTLSTTITTSTAPSKAVISKLTAGTKKITAVWKTVKGASGYEIQYSTSSKFKKAKTTTEKKATKKIIKKLKSGKKYYVRVRAYRTVDNKKIYGAWSSSKQIKVK